VAPEPNGKELLVLTEHHASTDQQVDLPAGVALEQRMRSVRAGLAGTDDVYGRRAVA
jgi:hypothetical protein